MDPLWHDIETRLDGPLEGNTFEDCAIALLQDEIAGLSPVRGGNDAGFDGAVPSLDGAFPLLCSVAKDGPLRNLRKNLASYKKAGGEPAKAVIATPRRLTPVKRRNLERVAREEFGVTLVNVYDQAFFVERLYRNAAWRKKLLGLTGRPSALAKRPPRSREQLAPLYGRDEDLDWILNRKGDLLLIGQPGVGKTFLQQAVVEQRNAFFLMDEEPEAVADSLRREKPEIIIVDDAHENRNRVELLRQLRQQLDADFVIHANCWPSMDGETRSALEVSNDNVYELLPLPRQVIAELVRNMGIHGPDTLLGVLLNNAEGKPGLAAALVSAVKRGEGFEAWSGEIVAKELLDRHPSLGDRKTTDVLACLALGGDIGLSCDEAAQAVGCTSSEVRTIVTNLAAGGVVEDVRRSDTPSQVSVRPECLRPILIKKAFFDQHAPLNLDAAIEITRSDHRRVAGLASSLMGARQREAAIPDHLLFKLVQEANTEEVWKHLAYVDQFSARWILREHPEQILMVAKGLLHYATEDSLRQLLEHAVNDENTGSLASPRRHIQEWIDGDEPGDPGTFERREQLLHVLEEFANRDDRAFADRRGWALGMVVAPNFVVDGAAPESFRTFRSYRGLYHIEQLEEIASLWPRVARLSSNVNVLPQSVREVVRDWCLPGRRGNNVIADTSTFMRAQGRQMLIDIAALDCCGRACQLWVKRLARLARLECRVRCDRLYERIFTDCFGGPDSGTRSRRREWLIERVALQQLENGPRNALPRLSELENEAIRFGEYHAWHISTLYSSLARHAEDPRAWLDESLRLELSPQYVRRFLHETIARGRKSRIEPLLEKLLSSETHTNAAVDAILGMDEPSDDLLDAAMAAVGTDHGFLRHTILAHQPPIETMHRLLTHPRREVRVRTAYSEWRLGEQNGVRGELRQEWRAAILDARDEDAYELSEILQAELELAFDWMQRKINDASRPDATYEDCNLFRLDDTFKKIASSLTTPRRWLLLKGFSKKSYDHTIVEILIANSIDLYERWLERHLKGDDFSRHTALKPLQRTVDEFWEAMVSSAFERGVGPDELFDYTGGPLLDGWAGSAAAHFREKLAVYDRLANHQDPRFRTIAEFHRERLQKMIAHEEREERIQAIRRG